MRIIISFVFSLVFAGAVLALTRFLEYDRFHTTSDAVVVILLLSLLYFAVMVFFAAISKDEGYGYFFLFAICAFAVLAIKTTFFDYVALDYTNFLSEWIREYHAYTGFWGIGAPVGNYNMPYMYFLYILSRFSLPNLYLIKIFSILFDFVLAYFAMKLVSLRFDGKYIKLIVFFSVLILPTVFFNSSVWAQCDGIYSTFAIAGLYYGIKNKPNLSMIMFGLSFAFKMQVMFIMPIVIVFLFVKKITLRSILWIPIVYLCSILPAIIAGRPVVDTLTIYLRQPGVFDYLSANAPSIYQLIPESEDYYIMFTAMGLILTALLIFAALCFLYIHREKIDNTLIIKAAFLFTLAIPFFLPKMHDRFFYMADILAFVYLFYNPKRWYIPAMVIFSSFYSYCNYLFYPLPIEYFWVSAAVLTAVALTAKDFFGGIVALSVKP